MRTPRLFIATGFAASIACASMLLASCGTNTEGVAKTFDEDAQALLATVNEDPNRAAVAQIIDDCARDAREGKISMMESLMFRNELKAAAKDGTMSDDDVNHMRSQHELAIKE